MPLWCRCVHSLRSAPSTAVADFVRIDQRRVLRAIKCSPCSFLGALTFVQEDLTPETIRHILDELSAGRKPVPGPQKRSDQPARRQSEPEGGLTSLTSKVSRSPKHVEMHDL